MAEFGIVVGAAGVANGIVGLLSVFRRLFRCSAFAVSTSSGRRCELETGTNGCDAVGFGFLRKSSKDGIVGVGSGGVVSC